MAYADNRPRTVDAVGPVFKITLTGAVQAGDLIGNSSGWVPASASTTPVIPAFLVALEDGAATHRINATNNAVITSVTGAVAAAAIFCSNTAGGTTTTAPGVGRNQVVGVSLSATAIVLAPGLYATPAMV